MYITMIGLRSDVHICYVGSGNPRSRGGQHCDQPRDRVGLSFIETIRKMG